MNDSINIAGIGLITSAGMNLSENWNNMLCSKSAINPVKRIDTSELISKNAAQIYLTDEELKKLVESRRKIKSARSLPMERAELLLFLAFLEALEDSGLTEEDLASKRTAVLIGTSLSGFTLLEENYNNFFKNKSIIHASALLTYPLHTCADRLAYEYNLSGIRYLFSTACSASLHPFETAEELFLRNEIDIAVTAGTDPLSLMSLAGFSSLKSLAHEKCTPFSAGDPGISIGEGAGVLILSKEKNKYGSLLGVSGTSDAYHPTASNPTGETIKKCIENCLNAAGIENEPAAIMSHGTGTAHNDLVEMRALKQVSQISEPYIMATKSVVGHTLGASGAVEAALLAKCLKENTLIPIANFTKPRQEDALNCVHGEPVKISGCTGLKSSFAFGGNNVSIVIGNKSAERKAIDNSDIVITGIGIISPYDVYTNDELLEKISCGQNCFKEVPAVSGFNNKRKSSFAGFVDEKKLDSICQKLRLKNVRKMDKISKMVSAAASFAIKDSGLKITTANSGRIGFISATGTGPLDSVSNFYTNLLEKGVKSADANIFPNTVVNAHLGYASIELKIKGYSTVIAQGTSGSYAALKSAKNLIESGKCDYVLAGAVSEYSMPYHKALLDIGYAGSLSEQMSYSASSEGNVVSEGCVFFLLEKESSAKERGVSIKTVLKNVNMYSTPCFPSTYKMDKNPLAVLFDSIKKENYAPSFFAGDGNALMSEKLIETGALKEKFPNILVTSAASYFGFTSGVTPLYNLALFALGAKENKIFGLCKNKTDLMEGLNVLQGSVSMENNSVLIGTVSPGGTSGTIFAGRY